MDIQLKKGLLEVCVLKILSKSDSYGYQIVKDMSEVIEISESTLYPILKRLENNDYLEVYSVEYNSRLRKYFRITASGKERINEFVLEIESINTIFDFIKEELYE
ncbi:MAG: PadR family transcriptional regulator [Lachnospirales bacterium]